MTDIPGYDYGAVPRSPVTLGELDELKRTVGWSEADAAALARAAALIAGEEEAMVDGWRAVIGAQPHLARVFTHPDGAPNDAYKAAVKARFVRWVTDILTRPFDQDWLDYQEEIGRRHTPAKKNATDGGDTPPVVPMRDLLAFLPPTLAALPARVAAKGTDPAEVEAVRQAWTRAVALTLALWTRPYVVEGLW